MGEKWGWGWVASLCPESLERPVRGWAGGAGEGQWPPASHHKLWQPPGLGATTELAPEPPPRTSLQVILQEQGREVNWRFRKLMKPDKWTRSWRMVWAACPHGLVFAFCYFFPKFKKIEKCTVLDFPGGPVVKNAAASAGDTGSIPGLQRCQGTDKPLHHNYWASVW